MYSEVGIRNRVDGVGESHGDTGVVEITPIEKRSCGENPNNPHINVKLRLRRIVLLVHPLPNSRWTRENEAFPFWGKN